MSKKNRKKPWQQVDMTVSRRALSQGGTVLSVEVDEAGDQAWFRAHPGAMERRRLATAAELAMSGRLPGTMLRIIRTPSGMLLREFPRRDRATN